MAEPANTPHYTCAQCGGEFTGRKRKYCGPRCNWNASSRRKGKKPLAERRADQFERTHRECPECKAVFRITRHDNHSNGPQVHCSGACRYAERRRQALIAREAALYRRWSAAAKRRLRNEMNIRRCPDCDEPAARFSHYCRPCADRRTAASDRASRKLRKYRERGAIVERFDPIEVLERDGWKCHLCGIRTPKGLRGTHDARAPELDHIVPIAAGGEHSRRNTACACRRCNITKGARPLGQLRLVA